MDSLLVFDESKYRVDTITLEGKTVRYRAFENIIYVEKPVDPAYQILNIYVPEEYYEDSSIGAYQLHTAPIFFPNTVGGYRPGLPQKPETNQKGEMNAVFVALLRGYVVASPGARGIGLTDADGKFTGVAPACIVDLKSAVRFLRFNRKIFPGDVEKIISNGTSAGGALSSLLGVTGNHPDYEPYLRKLGAADERDDIFAASCYCPITNLENADSAYEWEFHGLKEYHRKKYEMLPGATQPMITPVDGVMNELQEKLSGYEKPLFTEYLNKLGLKASNGTLLWLDELGNGSFQEYVKAFVIESAQAELAKGTDLSGLSWLKMEYGKVVDLDFRNYVAYRTRMKETPAFDNIAMGTPENELFGSPDMKFRHFTKLSKEYSAVHGEMAEEGQIMMMNPMNYIGDQQCSTAKHFRIRHGSVDRDTSLAISAILTTALRNNGVDVDYQLPWGVPHAGDYDLNELFNWVDHICLHNSIRN